MFQSPESRLSASNSAVLASESFLVPVTLHSEARTSPAAFDGLRKAFDEVFGFVSQLASTAPGIALVPFSESISPRMSRVEVLLRGKEYRYDLTFALKCPVPKEHDFWARVRLLSSVYDRLADLAAGFHDRKGIELYLEEARLDQQKDDSEKLQTFRK
ncbi:MAG TPA: hypothetical protein VFZ59_08095 [Verrucomicrobiae bacterium]|nr:hypothetical protein [Verrucomicrobiae bacterium]